MPQSSPRPQTGPRIGIEMGPGAHGGDGLTLVEALGHAACLAAFGLVLLMAIKLEELDEHFHILVLALKQ